MIGLSVNKALKLHIVVYSLASALLFIFIPISFIDRFLAGIIFFGVLFHIKNIRFEFKRWYEIVVFFITCTYLMFAIFGYDLFLANTMHLSIYYRLFYYALGFIWTCYVLQSFLDALKYLSKIKNRVCVTTSDGYVKKWLILFAILFALFMIWQRAFNPVIMSPDSHEYYMDRYIVGRSVIYVLINNMIMKIKPVSLAIHLIVLYQIIAFSCLLSTILMYLHVHWIRFKWILVVSIILPLIPSFGLHAITLWPDLIVGMTILWVSYVIIRIIDEIILQSSASQKQRISLYIQLCFALILMYYAKANTSIIYIVTALSLSVFFILRKKWKLVYSVALSAILILLIRFPGHDVLNAARDSNLDAHKFFAGIHDMQATYYGGGNFSEKTLAKLKYYIPKIDGIRLNFEPDHVKRHEWGNVDEIMHSMTVKEFIYMYTDTFIRNPVQMSRSMLYRVRAYWVIDPKGKIDHVNFTIVHDPRYRPWLPQHFKIHELRQPNFLTEIMNKYIEFMVFPVPTIFVWRYGIWTALMIISITTLIFLKRYAYLLAYIPVFIHITTLLLTSGWTDYRYGLPVLFVGLFLPVTLFLLNSNPDYKMEDDKYEI